MKITWKVVALGCVVALAISLGDWVWRVTHELVISGPWWTALLWGLAHAFTYPPLKPITFWSLAAGFGPVTIVIWLLDQFDDSAREPRLIRGPAIVSAEELDRLTRVRSSILKGKVVRGQIEVAGVALPIECESWHLLAIGSTGSGKSTCYEGMIVRIIARGDGLIVLDENGYMLARFGAKGDIVLNPFDKRCPGWSIFNEIRTDADYEWLARCIIPDASDSRDQAWHGYAQQLLAETMRAMARVGEVSNAQLIHWLTQASTAELANLLAGTAVARQFEPGADKALASTLFIVAKYLAPFQHLKPGNFSLRRWLEEGRGNMYITWTQTQLAILQPLVSAWTSILIAATLTLPEKTARARWLMLDELGSLGRLTSLVDGLTKGRKHQLRIVAGLQASSQLDAAYGVKDATTLRSCFGTLLALRCSSADPDTAKMLSEALGTRVMEREVRSRSARGEISVTWQQRTEPAVMASELTELPKLEGYLKIAGDFPIARVMLIRREHPQRNEPFTKL